MRTSKNMEHRGLEFRTKDEHDRDIIITYDYSPPQDNGRDTAPTSHEISIRKTELYVKGMRSPHTISAEEQMSFENKILDTYINQ